MSKLNCWEFNDCGRQPGGKHIANLGVCPVTTEVRLDGTHGGINAGRSCQVVAATLCKGEVQRTFEYKFMDCVKCDFYKTVKKEEYPNFMFSSVLIKKISDQNISFLNEYVWSVITFEVLTFYVSVSDCLLQGPLFQSVLFPCQLPVLDSVRLVSCSAQFFFPVGLIL